jgi:hypothetical protein
MDTYEPQNEHPSWWRESKNLAAFRNLLDPAKISRGVTVGAVLSVFQAVKFRSRMFQSDP